MKENNYFSTNLKYLRQRRGLTQGELAKKISVDQTTIGRWEDGNREPTVGNALNISNIFNVDITSLLNEDLRELNNDIILTYENDNKLLDAIRSFSEDKVYEELLIKCTHLIRPNRDKILELVNMYLKEQGDGYIDEDNNLRLFESDYYDDKDN